MGCLGSDSLSDLEKLQNLVAKYPSGDAVVTPIEAFAARLTDDLETQCLLQTIAQDERSSTSFLIDHLHPTERPGVAARIGRLPCACSRRLSRLRARRPGKAQLWCQAHSWEPGTCPGGSSLPMLMRSSVWKPSFS